MEPYYDKDNHGHLYGRVARPSDKIEKIEELDNEPVDQGFPWTGENIKALIKGYWCDFLCNVWGHKHVTKEKYVIPPNNPYSHATKHTRAVIHKLFVRCGHYDPAQLMKDAKKAWRRGEFRWESEQV